MTILECINFNLWKIYFYIFIYLYRYISISELFFFVFGIGFKVTFLKILTFIFFSRPATVWRRRAVVKGRVQNQQLTNRERREESACIRSLQSCGCDIMPCVCVCSRRYFCFFKNGIFVRMPNNNLSNDKGFAPVPLDHAGYLVCLAISELGEWRRYLFERFFWAVRSIRCVTFVPTNTTNVFFKKGIKMVQKSCIMPAAFSPSPDLCQEREGRRRHLTVASPGPSLWPVGSDMLSGRRSHFVSLRSLWIFALTLVLLACFLIQVAGKDIFVPITFGKLEEGWQNFAGLGAPKLLTE